MRVKHLLLSIAIGVSAGLMIFSGMTTQKGEGRYTPRSKTDIATTGIAGAIAWRNKRLENPSTGSININDVLEARRQVAEFHRNKGVNALGNLEWEEMGPSNIGGRTRALLIDNENSNLMFAGGVAGGLWKSTTGGTSWNRIEIEDSESPILTVSCIHQTANGDIYFGTGEGWAHSAESPYYTGSYGEGIWKSTDHGATFTRLSSTWDETNGSMSVFYLIFEIASDPANSQKIYAATANGVRVSTDGGTTWNQSGPSGAAGDLAVASDGSVLVSVNRKLYYKGSSDTDFAQISETYDDDATGNDDGKISHNGVGRLEIAFAPSDPNVAYVSSATTGSELKHIYKTVDHCSTWEVVGFKSNLFSPFSNSLQGQGIYDNVIKVFPDDPHRALLGGVYAVWLYANETWSMNSWWGLDPTNSLYVHADQHGIVFDPDFVNNGIYWVSSDGGLSKYTPDYGFQTMNTNYNVTQFYSVACSNNDEVMGGTQDNGTLYINKLGNTPQYATKFSSGDGGYCAISMLNPDVAYSTYVQGQVLHRTDKGLSNGYTDDIQMSGTSSWVSPFRLWENFNDTYSWDTVVWVNDTIYDLENNDTIVNKYYQGEEMYIQSAINELPIPYTVVEDSIVPGDTVIVQDIYQAAIAHGQYGGILVARDVMNFAEHPTWHQIVHITVGQVQTLEWSKDGDHIYFTTGNRLYRSTGLNAARGEKEVVIGQDTNWVDVYDTVGFTVDTLLDETLTDTTVFLNSTIDTTLITIIDSVVIIDTVTFDTTVYYDTIQYVDIDTNYFLDTTFTYFYYNDTTWEIEVTQEVGTIVPITEDTDYYDLVETTQIGYWPQIITSISVDPNDPNRVLVTLGNYGTSDHIMYTANGLGASPTWSSKQGDLPGIPVHCGLLVMDSTSQVIIGTEYGLYATQEINSGSPTWVEVSRDVVGIVPVFMIRQQTFDNGYYGSVDSGIRNSGYIYIGTHGRGIFKCDYYKRATNGPEPVFESVEKTFANVNMYPNPVRDNATVSYNLDSKTNVTISVYDIHGKRILSEELNNQPEGEHTYQFDASNLSTGTYILHMTAGTESKSSKFIVH